MEFNISIISLVDILGLIQGAILGLIILVKNKNQEKSTTYLGMFILAYSLDMVPSLSIDLGFSMNVINAPWGLFNLNWLLFPLFFLYVQKISVLQKKKILWPLKFAVIAVLVELILYLFIPNIQFDFSYLIIALDSIEIIFGISIGVKIVNWINKHNKEVKDQYSSTKNKQLLWAKQYTIIGVFFILLSILVSMFLESKIYYLLISIANITLLYWVSINGLFQNNINSLLRIIPKEEKNNHTPIKKVTRLINDSKTDEILNRTKLYLKNTQDFINPDFTIIDISNAISVHPKKLSTCINQKLKMNFNTFINNYRVELAKDRFADTAYSNLSIEGVGIEVGFQSKSAFYSAFKRVTGMTPNNYRQQLKKE